MGLQHSLSIRRVEIVTHHFFCASFFLLLLFPARSARVGTKHIQRCVSTVVNILRDDINIWSDERD